jgi:hypothetical protein
MGRGGSGGEGWGRYIYRSSLVEEGSSLRFLNSIFEEREGIKEIKLRKG